MLAVASVFVFALVVSILLVSVLRFRRRFGDESDGEPIHGNTGLEVIWTAIPTVIMIVAAIASGVVLADIEEKKPGTKTIVVTGEQFAWTFDYRDEGVRRAGELHLVKDTPYLFKIRAKDVLHSFWVPEFRMKKDAVPGHDDRASGSSRSRTAPTRSSAPSSAGSATRRCARGSSSRTRPGSTAGPRRRGGRPRPPAAELLKMAATTYRMSQA